MSFIRATSGSGGGGTPDYLAQVYKNGVWDNTLKTLIKTNSVTEGSAYLTIGTSQGSGIYINTDESATYSGLIVVISDNSAAYRQWGICNTGATLPTIITGGSGRVTYWYNATNEAYRAVTIPIQTGKGVFYGISTNGSTCNITEIYLVKKTYS